MDIVSGNQTNCIRYVDTEGNVLPDIPCVSYEFPNFNNLNFDAHAFDKAIENWFGNEAFDGNSPYQYPDLNNTNNYLTRKRTTKRHLQEHQRFPAKYINMHNNFTNGILVYHFLGSGKTCSSVVIGEAYKQFMKDRKVIVVIPNALKEQYREEILGRGINVEIEIHDDDEEETSSKKETSSRKKSETVREIDACTADIRVYKEGELVPITRKPPREVGKSILKRIPLMSSKQHEQKSNILYKERWIIYTHQTFINRIDSEKIASIPRNDPRFAESQQLREAFDDGNQLFIFDEIQNLVTEPDRELRDSGKRYRTLSNVLQVYSNRNNRYVLLTATPIRNRPYEIGLLLNLINPRLHFPESETLFNNLFMDETRGFINRSLFRWMCKGYVTYFKGGNPDFFPKKRIEYMYHEMCQNQAGPYLEELEKILKTMKDPDDPFELLNPTKNFQSLLRLLSYNFPENRERVKEGLDIHGLNYIHNQISPKIAKVVKMVDTIKEKSFIYSEYIGRLKERQFGIVIMVWIFEYLGYEIIYGGNVSDFQEPKKRIIIWTGSQGGLLRKPNTDEVARIVEEVFNAPQNKNGNYIKAIIGSSAIKEGISFKSVNNVHLLSPWWNNARTDQIIGRAIRFRSHEPGETVNVYRHITIMENTPYAADKSLRTLSIEQYMDLVSARKSDINTKFELALKQSSVDCRLNQYGNLMRLTEINDIITIKRNHELQQYPNFIYFLDESNGNTYLKSMNGKYQKVKIKGNPTRFGITTITRLNETFNPISKQFPTVAFESLNCSSKMRFEAEPQTYDFLQEIIEHTEKTQLAPIVFEHIDNKNLLKCLAKTINEHYKTQFKKFVTEDKDNKKMIDIIINRQLEEGGLMSGTDKWNQFKSELEHHYYKLRKEDIKTIFNNMFVNS